jgi:hypothetical protein
MNDNSTTIDHEAEFASALKFLTIIAQARETMGIIRKIFRERFEPSFPDVKTVIQNKTLRERDELGRRLLSKSFGVVQVTINPIFDTEPLFRIFYTFYFDLKNSQYKFISYIGLEISRETPLGDPWSVEIQASTHLETTLDKLEARILELSESFIHHAQNFNFENPLEGTIFEAYYPKIKQLFTTIPWNKFNEAPDSYAYEQLNNGTWKKFDDDVSALRLELYAIKKQAKELTS